MDCPFWRFVMKLAAMTFSLMGERVLGLFNASGLCEMAKAAGVDALDLLDVELMLYGRKKLKQAMAKYGIRFECLIGGTQMFSGGSKVPGAIDNLLKQAADMGASMLMLVPGQPTPAEKKACLGLSADQKRIVELVDVLIDGKYNESLKDRKLLWRGSSNQIIHRFDRSDAWWKKRSQEQSGS